MTMKPYVVKQGDYLTKLASARGFSADEVWNHPKNSDLRQRRPNRDVLYPGDVLYLPDAPRRGRDLATGSTNRFKARVPKVDINLSFRDADGRALANQAYRVEGAAAPITGQTDGDGKASFLVPVHVREAKLVFEESGRIFRLRIGDMDPADESSGVKKRLAHLGYYVAKGAAGDEQEQAFRLHHALRDFQQDRGLRVTGEIDDATRQALLDAHGT